MSETREEILKAAVAYLRALVPVMRELGVVTFEGLTLDPAFRPPARNPYEGMSPEETAKAKREGRILAARQEVRDKLGDYHSSDEFIDQYIEPSVLE